MSYIRWDLPPPTGSRFADRLRTVRLAAGLSAPHVAERADVALDVYMGLESGRAPMTAAMLMRLATAMQIAPEVFFDLD